MESEAIVADPLMEPVVAEVEPLPGEIKTEVQPSPPPKQGTQKK